MVGTNLMDEIDCGSFFDHIDDLLDFPSDDLDAELAAANADFNSFPSIFPDCSSDPLLGSDAVFSDNSASDLSAQLSVPYEDIVQLEWLSTFVEDSFSGGGMTMEKNNLSSTKDSSSSQSQRQSQSQFQTSSPVSVLESCSSSFGGKTIPVSHEKKARSKRPRPPTFNPRPSIDQLISPTSSLITDTPDQPIFIPSAESMTTSADSRPLKKTPKEVPGDEQPKIKKKKIKIVFPSNRVDPNPNPTTPNAAAPQAVRKCMHCEITKTPQWRAGPMGPKTLCNACGVRYKSGRLFPEYRPAASPTFTPSIHSNSHKKVVEMRNMGSAHKESVPGIIPNSMTNALGIDKSTSQQPEVIPRSDLLPTCI